MVVVLVGVQCHAIGMQGVYGFGPSDQLTQKSALTLGIGSDQWIFSLGVIFNSQYSNDEFQKSPIPHTDYQSLGEQRIGNTLGIDILRSYRINESNFSLYGGGGLYFGRKANLVKSNVTGWLWAQNEKSATNVGVEAGLFYGEEASTQFGISYHTVKGASLYLRAGNF